MRRAEIDMSACCNAPIEALPMQPDGYQWARCAGCGDDSFPVVDPGHEEMMRDLAEHRARLQPSKR